MRKAKERLIKALIVDDNEVNYLVLSNMLSVFHIAADEAVSGKQAIKMCKKEEYNLIFIDHLMYEMDGLETTIHLRRILTDKDKAYIFALTGEVTSEIRVKYLDAGANDVFTKPLGIYELNSILFRWFHKQEKYSSRADGNKDLQKHEEQILDAFRDLKEIDYELGLKYAMGNPIQYMNILKVSLKDIHTYINHILKKKGKSAPEDFRYSIHNLKNILSNIGAKELFDESKILEGALREKDMATFSRYFDLYILNLIKFKDRLKKAIHKYETHKFPVIKNEEESVVFITEQEYEQSISDTIYYISRYEYDFVLKELSKLIRSEKTERKEEFCKAFEDVRNFRYDKALARILKIKENGNL